MSGLPSRKVLYGWLAAVDLGKWVNNYNTFKSHFYTSFLFNAGWDYSFVFGNLESNSMQYLGGRHKRSEVVLS